MGPYVLCSLQNISQGAISQFKRIGPCAWSCVVTGLLYGKPEGQWFSKRPAKVDTTHARRYLIVHHRSQSSSLLQEAKSLIWTATGEQQAKHITIGVKHEVALRGGAAVRQGHLAAIKHEAGLHAITDVILNFSTTASHLSRISQALQPAASSTPQSSLAVTVKDRTGVVLDIFKKHASSAEAHLQVRLAELRYLASRVVRRRDQHGRLVFGVAGQESEVVSARGRGGTGTVGGSGEKEAVVVAARSRASIAKVVQHLQEVRKRRGLSRARRRRDGHAVVALVGYTNAGKSTLMSALCKEDVGAVDRLFATLDTKIRRAATLHGRSFLLVDTVGFIQGLPLQLVAAFQATLDEALEADLVVHVIDAASPSALQQRRTVLGVLAQLGMSEHCLRTRMVEVWNKADMLMDGRDGSDGKDEKHARVLGSPCGAAEDQWRLWQLVQSQLHREARQPRSAVPPVGAYEHEAGRGCTRPLSVGSDDVSDAQSASYECDGPEAGSPPELQMLEVETASETSSAHGVGVQAYAGTATWGTVNDGVVSGSSATRSSYKQGDSQQQGRVVESDDSSYEGGSGHIHPSSVAQDCHESDSGESDSVCSGLQGAWDDQYYSEGGDSEWAAADNAVVVSAKEGLGLERLTEIITQKLQHNSKSSTA